MKSIVYLRRASLAVAAGLALLPISVRAQAEGSSRVALQLLGDASTQYAALGTLCADFEQVLEVTLLRRTREGRGRLCQRSPNLFSMRFEEPAGDLIVVDGTWMWMYTPSNDPQQALQFGAEGVDGRFNFHRAFLEDPLDRFDITDLGMEQVAGVEARRIGMAPHDRSSFEGADVWIDPASLLIVRVRILDLNESVRTITLSNQRRDPAVDEDVFRFTPPDGVRILKRGQ